MNQIILPVKQNQRISPLRGSSNQTLKRQAEIAIRNKTACFDDLVVIEPRLQSLMNEAKEYRKQSKGKRHVCANNYWYGSHGPGLKDKLIMLVGWDARNRLLRTEFAYDIAYEQIYDALPACKNCGCLYF